MWICLNGMRTFHSKKNMQAGLRFSSDDPLFLLDQSCFVFLPHEEHWCENKAGWKQATLVGQQQCLSAFWEEVVFKLLSHVQRHLFLWQASASDVQPSESLSEKDGPAEEGPGKREDRSGPSEVSSVEPLLRLSTQPSLLWSNWRRPGGSGSTSKISIQSGTSWRRRAQHR